MNQLLDYKGSEIKPGVRVAFNQSGQVRLGTVKELKPSKTNREYGGFGVGYIYVPVIHVLPDGQPGHTAKVTSRKNLVVLED